MDYSLSVTSSGFEPCTVVYETVVRNNSQAVCEYSPPGQRECRIYSVLIDIHVNKTFCAHNAKLGYNYFFDETNLFFSSSIRYILLI